MLTKKVGFELGTWSKNYLAFIARREYEALNEKKWQAVGKLKLVETTTTTLFWTNRDDWRLLF